MRLFGKKKKLFNVHNAIFGTAVLDYNKFGTVIKANKTFYEIIGYTKEEFERDYSNSLINLMSEDELRYSREKAKRQLESFSDLNLEISIKKKDEIAYLYVSGQITKSFWRKKRLWCIFADISYTKMANKQLLQINMDLDRFVSNLPGGAYRFSYGGNGEFDFVSRGLYELFDCTSADFRKRTENKYENILPAEERSLIQEDMKRQLSERGTYDVEYKVLTCNNQTKWVSDRAQVVSDNSGDLWICGFITDITDSKKQKRELELSREKYHIVSDLLEDILFDYNISEDTITFSGRFLEHFDCDEVVRDYVEFIYTSPVIFDGHRTLLSDQFEKVRKGELKCIFELLMKERADGYKWYSINLVSIRDELGRPLGAVGKLTCIHEQKEELERLQHRANLDALTGLYNKSAVKTKIEEKLLEAKASGKKCALMIIDIDNFKAINDNRGHLFGDTILTELSAGLSSGFADKAVIGRVGGDEFVIFFDQVKTRSSLEQKAEKICSVLQNIYPDDPAKTVSGSVGIAVYPEHGSVYEELFQKADIALYGAKNKGKNRFEFYDSKAGAIPDTIISVLQNETQKLCSNSAMRFDMESAMLNYLFAAAAAGSLQSAVTGMLDVIGTFYQFGRICIFMKSIYCENDMEVIYEWFGRGKSPLAGRYNTLKFTNLKDFIKLFDNDGIFESRNLSDMPVEQDLKRALNLKDKESAIQLAVYENGDLEGLILTIRSETEQERAEEEKKTLLVLRRLIVENVLKISSYNFLVSRNKTFTMLAEKQGLYCYTVNANNFEIIDFDKKTVELFPETKTGKRCFESFFGKTEQCKHCPARSLGNKDVAVSEIYNEKIGAWLSITANKTLQPDSQQAYSISCCNISRLVERIRTKDELTGLLSVSAFIESAERLLRSFPDKNYAFVSMDIVKFKFINETAGSSVGDKVLVSVANVLSSTYFYDELVCRSNADKFVLLLRYSDRTNLERRLGFIHQKLSEMQQKEYKNLKITVISGVYLVGEDKLTVSGMIDKASIARKEIKNTIKNEYFIYNDDLHNLITKEKDIEIKMQQALENCEFVVYLQPKKELAGGNLCGAEALVRWNTEDGKLIPPGDFVPLFEKNGFVIEMDFYVYEQIFKTVRRWLNSGISPVPVSVNVSRLHLSSKEFIMKMQDLLSRYLVPPALIELELTESIFINYDDTLVDIIGQLKDTGFSVSIDDFGSGYSSLNMLKNLPVDIIKLDKSFFSEDSIAKKEKIIVSNIVRLAKDLNIKVIAEGVESREQAEFLREIGCDMAQGYYCGRAVSVREFEKLLPKQVGK